MQTRKILSITVLLLLHAAVYSQNVGIGTDNPAKKLSVAGSIAVDHNNQNMGTLDSAALVFGTGPSLVGIFSRKTPGSGSYNGLDFWTDGERRMIITEGGTVAIAAQNPDPNADLFVGGTTQTYFLETNIATVNNSAYITSDVHVGGHININGNPFNNAYRLTVNNGNSYFGGNGSFTGYIAVHENAYIDGQINCDNEILAGGDIVSYTQVRGQTMRATEQMGIGGNPDPLYRLRVWNGNSRFGGDVQVTGTLDAGEITTDEINGGGVVRSNGSSPLRMGFNSIGFNTTLNGGNQTDVTVNITEFEGGPNDVRVSVAQFVADPLPQYANWHDFSFHVHSVNPVNDTCKVRITNTTDGQLSIKGTLYVLSVAKD
jgi:hypothetical protein